MERQDGYYLIEFQKLTKPALWNKKYGWLILGVPKLFGDVSVVKVLSETRITPPNEKQQLLTNKAKNKMIVSKELAREYFNNHPETGELFFTSDGRPFLSEKNACNNASMLEDVIVSAVTREEAFADELVLDPLDQLDAE